MKILRRPLQSILDNNIMHHIGKRIVITPSFNPFFAIILE
jgi:hypothetical protein